MSTPPAPARVFGFVAAEADVCVLLRRGPSRRVLMVRWDLATDAFEIGQWVKTDLKPERSALSPDGKLFASYVLDYRQRPTREEGAYVSVSRPPYFTALALWWTGGMHLGGARWHGSRALSTHEGDGGPPDKGLIPAGFDVHLREKKPQAWWWETALAPIRERAAAHKVALSIIGEGQYAIDGKPLVADWADIDHRGRLLVARAGRIYVHNAEGEREFIDLNPFEFRPLAPPAWAREWPV